MTQPKTRLPPPSDHFGREFPAGANADPAEVRSGLAKQQRAMAPALSGLSPGEVPRLVSERFAPWLLLAAVLGGAVVYFKLV